MSVETYTIAKDSENPIQISRIINGLWQLAGGHDTEISLPSAVEQMNHLGKKNLTTFDMADHYGPAELVIGEYNSNANSTARPGIQAFTKWCPKPGPTSFETARDAVNLALQRMKQSNIALLQYHIWKSNLSHLVTLQKQGKITHLGLTNTDLAHLKLLKSSGIKISTNQVSVSVLDCRLHRTDMGAWCEANHVAILAYGTLLGGFLSEKWVGVKDEPKGFDNWSLRKYKRFIDAAGGWTAYQIVLDALATISKKHNVSIPAVATRHVLDLPGVAAVIVGTRLTASSSRYTESNLAAFSFQLDDEDRGMIREAQEGLKDIPGDCGDEYRRRPYLTASGDLSDHLDREDENTLRAAVEHGKRIEYSSGSPWEPIAGYCRAVRIGNHISVSGTTATALPNGQVVGGTSAADQATHVFDIIAGALKALGSDLPDVVRSRVFLRNVEDCQAVAEAHGRIFEKEGIRPANTMMAGLVLVGDELLLEIEVEAEVGSGKNGILRM